MIERTRPLILLTDDDDDVRSVFAVVLEDQYEVVTAATARGTLELVAELHPDVLLLDWTLPDARGDEVIERVRALGPAFARLPVVVVSGDVNVKARARELGTYSCPKPCDIEQLTGAVQTALAESRALPSDVPARRSSLL